MSEKHLLAHICYGLDSRITHDTKYQVCSPQTDGIIDRRIYYTIPPKALPNIYDDLGPVVKSEHMPTQGAAEFKEWVSGERRIYMAYASEIDTVFWRVGQD